MVSGFNIQVAGVLILLNVCLAWGTWLPIQAGQLSLGSAVNIGIAAYGAVYCEIERFPLWSLFVVSVALSLVVSLVLWIISLRLSSFSLALATLGILVVVFTVVGHFGVLGGVVGLTSPYTLSHPYWYIVPLLGFCGLFGWWVVTVSRVGLEMALIARDPLQASALGVKGGQVSLLAFVVSGVVLGVGGTIFGLYGGYVSPDQFGLGFIVELFALAVIGGRDSWVAPIVGATLLGLLVQVLGSSGGNQTVIYGVALTVAMILRPGGLLKRSGWMETWHTRRHLRKVGGAVLR